MERMRIATAIFLIVMPWLVTSQKRTVVDMTVVAGADKLGAFCLDGSPPAYNLDRGTGAGARNWLLQFEGGGWCNDVKSCQERSKTHRGSTRFMEKKTVFNGIMSREASENPDFYNWNRVRLRYCDGASFSGDSVLNDRGGVLQFKGKKIWEAIIQDLLTKGLATAENALLTGCSAGGLSTFIHCDNFRSLLPKNANVKCMSDAGFFIDAIDIRSNRVMRTFFDQVVSLQGIDKHLDPSCKAAFPTQPSLCFFPQNILPTIQTPFFVLNTAYDVYQFRHGLVPPTADPAGHWQRCKTDPASCNPQQLQALQAFRQDMLNALNQSFKASETGGMFINSCFAHCQSSLPDTWSARDSPMVNGKRISEAVGDWYFNRKVTKEIDCPYPCDKTCHNHFE